VEYHDDHRMMITIIFFLTFPKLNGNEIKLQAGNHMNEEVLFIKCVSSYYLHLKKSEYTIQLNQIKFFCHSIAVLFTYAVLYAVHVLLCNFVVEDKQTGLLNFLVPTLKD